MKHRKRKDVTRRADIALQEKGSRIDGNVATTGDGSIAWYVLPSQPWSFTGAADREALVNAAASTWSRLAGHRIHLRGTQRPYPAPAWARALYASSPDALPGYSDYLADTQEHLRARHTSVQEWYLGVDVVDEQLGERITQRFRRANRVAAVDRQRTRVGEITEAVGGAGVGGQPVTGEQLAWLVNRSVGLGLPPQMRDGHGIDDWDADDAFMFTEQVIVEAHPLGRSVRIRDVGTGQERFVVILTMGPMKSPVSIPETARMPWLAHAVTRLSFPVEVSVRAEILSGQDAAAEVEAKLRAIRDQQEHYREHNLDEPNQLERQAQIAKQIEDDMENGSATVATRVHAHVRFAVWGNTEQEALARARELKTSYAARNMEVITPRAQYALYREFCPSEPEAQTGYLRRLPVLHWAAATPAVSTDIGDNRGPLLGRAGGVTRRGVFLDTHHAMEHLDASGLTVLIGQLGSGKSMTLGVITHDAVMRGIHSTVLDPSGPLSALCDMPALRDYARHIPLTSAAAGTLNPYRVVAEADRNRFADLADFDLAKKAAEAQRKGLVLDVLRMLLPPALDVLPDTERMLLDVVEDNGGGPGGSLWGIVEKLEARESTKQLGRFYRNVSYQPLASLMFAPGEPHYRTDRFDDLLTVLTMPGLVLPNRAIPRTDWTNEERMAVPLLHVAAVYTTRSIYSRPRDERKYVAMDEIRQLADWSAGRSLFVRLATDSRKWNTCVVASSQNPDHILGMGDVGNLVGSVMVGRVNDHKTAGDALDLLGVPRGVGFEQVLMTLSAPVGDAPPPYRDFVMRDARGRVETVTIDLAHRPELLRALNTRATGISIEKVHA